MPWRAPIAKPPGSEHRDRNRLRERRAHALGRLYDSAHWRKRTQPAVLARDPLCQLMIVCDGSSPSTDADHTIPAEKYVAQHGGDLRWFFDLSNLKGACKQCHTAKTARGG